MAKFLAVTSKGLGPILAEELKEMDLKVGEAHSSSVEFESSWAGCYKANLNTRIATRILLPVLDFPAYQTEDIYFNCFKKHDFTKYIASPDRTIKVDASVSQSKIRDQRLLAMTLKDAIVDQCQNKWGSRPNVDTKNPSVVFFIKSFKNQVSVSIDTAGFSLSQRGYRVSTTQAPLREHLAAGLLRMTKWDGTKPIVDLMCGSGTFLIEAALMKHKIFPSVDRGPFSFQKFNSFQNEHFEGEVQRLIDGEIEQSGDPNLFGFDVSGRALQAARENIEKADLDDSIVIKKMAVDQHRQCPTTEKGIVVINPPYGERLSNSEEIKDIYRDLAFTLKNHYKGWEAWILSGSKDSTEALRLKASEKHTVYNGSIECRWLKYEIR